MEFALHIVSGPSAGTKIVVKAGETVSIGRAARSRYVIAGDSRMSGLHCQIEAGEAELRLRDLGSTNGTFVNGARVNEAVVREGDQIDAGDSRFVVRVVRDQPKAEEKPASEQRPAPAPAVLPRRTEPKRPEAGPVEAKPAAGAGARAAAEPAALQVGNPEKGQPAKPKRPPKPLTPQQQTLLKLLREKYQPLYALLDAARDPKIVGLLRQSKEQYQSLYEGPQAEKLAMFAPYLVRLRPDSPLLEDLVRGGWGKNWGVYLTSSLDPAAARRQFRRFLKALLPDGKEVYFRFYDPRVLRLYLPTCNGEETALFFRSIARYLTEDEVPESLLEFTPELNGVEQKSVKLAPPGGAEQQQAPPA